MWHKVIKFIYNNKSNNKTYFLVMLHKHFSILYIKNSLKFCWLLSLSKASRYPLSFLTNFLLGGGFCPTSRASALFGCTAKLLIELDAGQVSNAALLILRTAFIGPLCWLLFKLALLWDGLWLLAWWRVDLWFPDVTFEWRLRDNWTEVEGASWRDDFVQYSENIVRYLRELSYISYSCIIYNISRYCKFIDNFVNRYTYTHTLLFQIWSNSI